MRSTAKSARTLFAVRSEWVIRFALGFLAIAWATLPAIAQWRPAHEVEFVVPFGSGGGADLMARVVTKIRTEERLIPVPVNVNNKPGGGTSVGIACVANNKHRDPHVLVPINPQSQITPIRVLGVYRSVRFPLMSDVPTMLKRLQQGT